MAKYSRRYIVRIFISISLSTIVMNKEFLKLRLLDAAANLIEVDLLASDKRLLQVSSNLNCLDSVGQLHRERSVVEARSSEVISLLDESRPEAAHEVWWDLASDTSIGVVVYKVALRIGIDSKLALCANDLGGILLSSGHHTGAVVVGNLAVLELDDTNSVVVVLVLAQLGLHSSDTVG